MEKLFSEHIWALPFTLMVYLVYRLILGKRED